jgi:hypothetical protein
MQDKKTKDLTAEISSLSRSSIRTRMGFLTATS